MSEETKTKILQAIEELSYIPNPFAQSLKTKQTHIIGIILSDISNPFWAEVLKGVQMECMKNGYGLMVSSSNENPDIERNNIITLKNSKVDGLIVNTTGSNSRILNELVEEKFPFVLLDRLSEDIKTDTVTVDNVLGSKEAIRFLIEQGHKRIGILLYPLEHKSPRIERLQGYKKALEEYGITLDESLIKVCDFENGSGIKATCDLLSLPNRPTAIFSTHSFLNLEVLSGIKKSGFKVPKDVSVIGYDDYPWVPHLDPPLTTVAQPAFKMGIQAMKLLINKLKRKEKTIRQIIRLKPQLVIRESCIVRNL